MVRNLPMTNQPEQPANSLYELYKEDLETNNDQEDIEIDDESN